MSVPELIVQIKTIIARRPVWLRSRTVLIVGAAVIAASLGSIAGAIDTRADHNTNNPIIKDESRSSSKQSTPSTSVNEANAAVIPASTGPEPAKNTAAPSSKSVPSNNASNAESVDFSFSQSVVTVSTTGITPVIRATSVSGRPIEWAVLGGYGIGVSGAAGVSGGLTSNGRTTYHEFRLGPSPSITKPGTYSMNVMGYIPGGPSVTKQLTIIVTQGQTFTLQAVAQDHSQDSPSLFSVAFRIEPVAIGVPIGLGPMTATADVIGSTGSPVSLYAIGDDSKPYVIQKKVTYNRQGSVHVVIRVTVSDGVQTTSLDIPYDIQ